MTASRDYTITRLSPAADPGFSVKDNNTAAPAIREPDRRRQRGHRYDGRSRSLHSPSELQPRRTSRCSTAMALGRCTHHRPRSTPPHARRLQDIRQPALCRERQRNGPTIGAQMSASRLGTRGAETISRQVPYRQTASPSTGSDVATAPDRSAPPASSSASAPTLSASSIRCWTATATSPSSSIR